MSKVKKISISLIVFFAVTVSAQTVDPTLCAFTHSLTIGATGKDVQCLQKYLNSKGFRVSATGAGSPGNESMYFGAKTRAAVAVWQQANNVSPAAGYFGPISRAKYSVLTAATTILPAPPSPLISPPPPNVPSEPAALPPPPAVSYTLSVLSPKIGDIVRIADMKNISWDITPLPTDRKTARIYLRSLDGAREIPIVNEIDIGAKKYSWNVAVAESLPDRFILVLDMGETKTESGFFTLARKDWVDLTPEQTRPKVIIPSKNTLWPAKIARAIEWSGGGFSWAFKIELISFGSGAILRTIKSDIPNTGAYLWQIPNTVQGGEYKIRLHCTSCAATDIYDDSDVFEVVK